METAAAQHLLGEILRDAGGAKRLQEAEVAFCRCMAVREKLLGLHHPDVALAMLGVTRSAKHMQRAFLL